MTEPNPQPVLSTVIHIDAKEAVSDLRAAVQEFLNADKIPAFLTLEDAASLSQFHVNTIRKAVKSGKLFAAQPDGREYRIEKQTFMAWMVRNCVPPSGAEDPQADALLEKIAKLPENTAESAIWKRGLAGVASNMRGNSKHPFVEGTHQLLDILVTKVLTMKKPNQQHRFYCTRSASDQNENRHPQEVVRDWSRSRGFTILDAVPQSIADGWDFWIEVHEGQDLVFPSFFRACEWKPIGQV